MTQVTIEDLQKALVDERITTEQFFEVLVDNYGLKKATDIMVHNLNSCDGKFFPWE